MGEYPYLGLPSFDLSAVIRHSTTCINTRQRFEVSGSKLHFFFLLKDFTLGEMILLAVCNKYVTIVLQENDT